MPLRQIVVDSDPDPEIQEAFVASGEDWFALAPELRVPVSVGSPSNVSMAEEGDPDCTGRLGYTYLSIAQPPAVRLCPREAHGDHSPRVGARAGRPRPPPRGREHDAIGRL